MAGRAHLRSDTTPEGGVEVRLPWWGVALPAAAFAVLLLLLAGPADAHAASGPASRRACPATRTGCQRVVEPYPYVHAPT